MNAWISTFKSSKGRRASASINRWPSWLKLRICLFQPKKIAFCLFLDSR
jgi:hypothetical protein